MGLNRWGGIAGIVAGFAGILVVLMRDSQSSLLAVFYLISILSVIVALYAIYRYQKESAGTLGLIAFIFTVVGQLLQLSDSMGFIGGSLMGLGIILLGAAALRAKTFSSWVGWTWIAAVIVGLVGVMLLPNMQYVLEFLGAAFFGAGLIGAGRDLMAKA